MVGVADKEAGKEEFAGEGSSRAKSVSAKMPGLEFQGRCNLFSSILSTKELFKLSTFRLSLNFTFDSASNSRDNGNAYFSNGKKFCKQIQHSWVSPVPKFNPPS